MPEITIYAVFPVAASERGVEALRSAGFRRQDVSVLFSGNVGSVPVNYQRVTDESAAADVAGSRRVASSLVELGLPDSLAERYANRIVTDEAVLVSVRCETGDQEKKAASILRQSGAEDISSAPGTLL